MTARVQKVAEGSAWWKGASPRQSVANSLLQHATSPPIHPKKKNIPGASASASQTKFKEDKVDRLAPEARRASCQERVGFCEHGVPAIACVLGTGSKTRCSFTRHDHETRVPGLRHDRVSRWGATLGRRCSWRQVAVSASKAPFAADSLSSSNYFNAWSFWLSSCQP